MRNLTKGNPTRLMILFALPILLGNVCQLFYNLVDTKIVGEVLGGNSLAALGAASPLNTLIVGFLLGLTNGFAILVSRSFGAGNEKELRRNVAGTLVLGITTSIVLTIVSLIFLKPMLHMLHTPEEIMTETYGYISIILGGMTISMCYNICASVLRAMGDTVMPLLFLIFSAFMNIYLDRFFMIGLHTGVKGAAFATLISQFLSCILCLVYIYIRYPILRLKKKDFTFDAKLIKEMYASGASMGFMMSLVSLGTLALQSAINTLGTTVIIAHTAARKITELYMLLFSVLGTTMATYSGQNLGAGKVDRIKEGIRKAIKAAWIWSIGVIAVTWLFAPNLIRFLTSTTDPAVIENAVNYLRFDTAFYFVPAMITILRNTMQGIGDYKTPIISSSIELIGKIIVALFLAPILHYFGIILAEPIVWILMVIPLIIRIKTNPVLSTSSASNNIHS